MSTGRVPTLSEYYDLHYLPQRISVSPVYAANVRAVVRRFSALTGPLPLASITESHLATYARKRLDAGRANVTINREVRYLRMLLQAAFDDGLIERPPRRIKKLTEPKPRPEAWTVAEVERLLATASGLTGHVGPAPRWLWWLSLFLVAYWTGCRIWALLGAKRADYDGCRLTVRKQKNGSDQTYRLPECCTQYLDMLLAELSDDQERIWHWPGCRRWFFASARKIVESSGVRCPNGHGQLFARMRRTNLSYCAAADPAIAQRQADHASFAITMKHYIDPEITGEKTAADVLPQPRLPGPKLRIIG